MKRKFLLPITAIVCASLLIFGIGAYARSTSLSATSATVDGTLKSLAADRSELVVATAQGDRTIPVTESVWVSRDNAKATFADLKAGDRVEVILNSKDQAAFIKATSADAPAPTATPTPTATPSPKPTAAPATPSLKPDSGKKSPEQTPNGAMFADQSAYPGLDGIELKINGKNFKLQLKQNPGNEATKFELMIKPEHGGAIHLKGDEAARWISQLLATVDLKSADAKQKLLQQIASHYEIDPGKLHIELSTKWQQATDDDKKVRDQTRDAVKQDDENDDDQGGKHPSGLEIKKDDPNNASNEDHGKGHAKGHEKNEDEDD